MKRRVAVFVDAGFFTRIFTKKVDPDMKMNPEQLAKLMWRYWISHVDRRNGEQIYRIYFYDCPPLRNKAQHPISKENISICTNKFRRPLRPFFYGRGKARSGRAWL
ncbi:hypothetical protein LVJ85_05705 [Neisseria sp. Dent CA1/247]|uniref:hypothetical protein n=1 Tax=Neisseria sp. Dent CA1/247 TaxID=2912675 RepID=UPI001FD07C89|nr:hypothetical protein [Neisseria sp. Dent CA1/247]UOO77957.1 hypothetical protein LVJ85_05705 [Neisseria sp. Dent CA1/247]